MTFSYYASCSLRSGFTLVHYGMENTMIPVYGMVLTALKTHVDVYCQCLAILQLNQLGCALSCTRTTIYLH